MNFKEKAKELMKKYSHAWVFLYAAIYLPWFVYLENRVVAHHYIIHSPLDDMIPFVEYFIIPYYMWFLYMAVFALYFFFTDKSGFYRLASFAIIGMTAFLIICTFFPNGLNLRPTTFARDNVFVDLVRFLYSVDTPTNVLPSIHVYNTLAILVAISHSENLKKHKAVMIASYVLGILIILSTMFLKQHSVTDVIAAFAIACVTYPIVYASQMRKATGLSHQPI